MSNPSIDAALARLLDLDDLEVREHRDLYESIHTDLRHQLQSPESAGQSPESASQTPASGQQPPHTPQSSPR